jgi:hypothetical protein
VTYRFTSDWWTSNVEHWQRCVVPRLPRPFAWLEIGSFEGRSACWMLDEVMHPGDRLTCVDTFQRRFDFTERSDTEIAFDENVAGRAEKVVSRSVPFLAKAVAELAWHVVPVGGLIVLDDYHWTPPEHRASELPPKPAIDAILSLYGSRIDVLHHAWQVIIAKRGE